MIIATDAHRDRDDNSTMPYRVYFLDSHSNGVWSYIYDRKGNPKRFRSLKAACAAARDLEADEHAELLNPRFRS